MKSFAKLYKFIFKLYLKVNPIVLLLLLNCLGKDLMIIAGDIEKVFTEDDIRKRAEDEQKVCENHRDVLIANSFSKGKIGKCKG